MHKRVGFIACVFALVVLSVVVAGCSNKQAEASDDDVRALALGTTIDSVVEKLGSPHQRGRKVTLKSEGTMTKEYPRNLEACVWHGERTYLLSFEFGRLVKKEAFSPALTKVSVQAMQEDGIRDGNEIVISLTKGKLYGGDEL